MTNREALSVGFSSTATHNEADSGVFPMVNPCKHGARLDFGHLGGTSSEGDPDSWYGDALWPWLISTFSPATALDVGCGVGFAQKFFREAGIPCTGVDCPQMAPHHLGGPFIGHDFTEGPLVGLEASLVWCCEVAEHIDEALSHHLVASLVLSTRSVLAFSAAPVGAGGHHHVNCRESSYWVGRLTDTHHLVYREDLTEQGRALSTPTCGRSGKNYFRRAGLIFTSPPPSWSA